MNRNTMDNRKELSMEELARVGGGLSWEDILEFIIDTLNSEKEHDRT